MIQSLRYMLPVLYILFFTACRHKDVMPVDIYSDPLFKAQLTHAVDSIYICKKDRIMCAYFKNTCQKKYRISLGQHPVGPKHFEGDSKTPEGSYRISVKNEHSLYHLSLGISYPSARDRSYAKRYNKNTGGDIMIHGIPNDDKKNAAAYVGADWTAGCISVRNKDIDELFSHTNIGVPVFIAP